jgi:GNAT superfamily N-acetyltransferase
MVELLVTYMEMTAPPRGQALPAPVAETAIARERLARPEFLDLYRAVGEALQWDLRSRMTAEALDAHLASAACDIHLLRLAGTPAGFCEMDRSAWPAVEIVHFGLRPEAQGRRLGPYLLDRALRSAWQDGAARIWLHTDTNDHPKAEATYERAGFRLRERRWESFPD